MCDGGEECYQAMGGFIEEAEGLAGGISCTSGVTSGLISGRQLAAAAISSPGHGPSLPSGQPSLVESSRV